MDCTYYAYISSADSIGYHSTNKLASFTIELPSDLNIEENNWSLGLGEINLVLDSEPKEYSSLHICCDLVHSSSVNGKINLQLLRRLFVPKKTKYGKIFPQIYYVPISKSHPHSLTINILDQHLNPISLKGAAYMTLIFKYSPVPLLK